MLHIFLQPYYCPQNKSYLNLSRNILSINNTYITTASASFPNQKWGCITLHVPFFPKSSRHQKGVTSFFVAINLTTTFWKTLSNTWTDIMRESVRHYCFKGRMLLRSTNSRKLGKALTKDPHTLTVI